MERLALALGLLVFALAVANAQDLTIFAHCEQIPFGTLCINATRHGCSTADVRLFYNNKQLSFQKSDVKPLLEAIALNRDPKQPLKSNGCFKMSFGEFVIPGVGSEINICMTLSKFKVTSTMTSGCLMLSLGSITQRDIDLGCFSLPNCPVGDCTTDTDCNNAGTCNEIGMCLCNIGAYGLNCGISQKGSCITAPSFDSASKLCYKGCASDSKVEVTAKLGDSTVATKEYAIAALEDTKMELYCSSNAWQSCDYCYAYSNFAITDDKIEGCSLFQVRCNKAIIASHEMTCSTLLLRDDDHLCPKVDEPSTKEHSTSLISQDIVMIIIAIAVMLVLAGAAGGYFIYKHHSNKKQELNFEPLSLGGVDDDDNVALDDDDSGL